MEFTFTDEQVALKESIIRFAKQELNEDIKDKDKSGTFPVDLWQKCSKMNLMALPFPEKYGGVGANLLTTLISISALGYACKDAGLVHAITTQILCGMQIYNFANEDQKKKFLPGICSGDMIMAQAITEPDAGSDMMSIRSKGLKDGDYYVINGSKIFITNGPIADVVILFVVTDPNNIGLKRMSAFIFEKNIEGFTRSKPLEKMGLRTLQNGELFFDNCRVPESCLLGKIGQGAMISNESMELERILLPAAHLGTMERIYETCLNYTKTRQAFGQSISRFQSISNKIAKIKINLELGKLILYKAAVLKDNKKRASLEASIGKLFVSESLKQACLDAVQIHGGYGFMTEYEIERDLRDSIASTIYSGTSEIQYNIISKLIGL
ncbi:MAG: acyl-CoA dehydrogenase family protein [bacterium]|jgi:hypothetical protein